MIKICPIFSGWYDEIVRPVKDLKDSKVINELVIDVEHANYHIYFKGQMIFHILDRKITYCNNYFTDRHSGAFEAINHILKTLTDYELRFEHSQWVIYRR